MEQENKNSSLEELTNKANQKYKEILSENKITDILQAIGYFPDQTITNDVLILLQKPDATCVKRMKEWNYYKRSVNKSEKAIKVIAHYLEKYDVDYTDRDGTIVTKGVEKLKTDVGYLFDISQTHGEEYAYLNSNKENIAKHFEVVKSALERTARDFTVTYLDQDEKYLLDIDNKRLCIKDGLTVDEVIQTLIDNVAKILLSTRRVEGLEDFEDFEKNAVVYAVNSKLGLDLPEFNFSTSNLTSDGQESLKGNLQRVRSVTKQMLSNIENSIEKAVRDLDKKMAEQKQNSLNAVVETVEENTEQELTKAKNSHTKKIESEVQNA